MGHNTGCVDFQYVHERESFEVLYAVLKKRKKATFAEYTNSQYKRYKRPRLDTLTESSKNLQVPRAIDNQPKLSLSTSALDSLIDLADRSSSVQCFQYSVTTYFCNRFTFTVS